MKQACDLPLCKLGRGCIRTCDLRAEPVQTNGEVSEGRAEPATPATCANRSFAAQKALVLLSKEDVGPAFPVDAPAPPLLDPGTVHAIETVRSVGICRLCRKQVLSTEKSIPRSMYNYRHADCVSICSKMSYVLSKRGNAEVKHIWETHPLADRLAWWKSHEGMTGDKLVSVLMTIVDTRGEGVPKEAHILRDMYLPDQQDKFDDIMKNAETFMCPFAGVTLYADGEYKVNVKAKRCQDMKVKGKTCGERTAKIKKETAEQTSRVKTKKALTGPGGKATVKGKGLWAGLVVREQLKKNAVQLSVRSNSQLKTINALKKQITESMVSRIPAQMVSMLEVSERELTKINVQVENIMRDDRTEDYKLSLHRSDGPMYMDLKKLCKKGTIQINKQKNLFKLVHDHFVMLKDILQAVI